MSIAKIVHRPYGCDCGCCGHSIEVDGVEKAFALCEHPDEKDDLEKWARELVSYHLTDADLEGVDLDHIDLSGIKRDDIC